ncbi:MAG: class I SAM-dependent rRNA methyltransferase [Gammaproteobacteria bacterium]|nr:MAG: class I SAM-dependent rRNA methyltransferase [Gammaproteobacteria bacterium]
MSMAGTLPTLRLRPREDRRLRAGHPWIYSNEVDTRATPLKAFAPGELAVVVDARGRALGLAYVNPRTLIAARLLTRRTDTPIDRRFFVQRLTRALRLRDLCLGRPYYRWVHAEADDLPGLVVDRYGEYLVLQVNTAGMERLRPQLLAALEEVLPARGLVLRNDGAARALEGLPGELEVRGTVPERVLLEEDGAVFETSLFRGQKTGWFYDQADNRRRLARYVHGRRVLDLFGYAGAWSIQALRRGAREALCVDSSATALELARANAERNGVADRLVVHEGDAFATLRALEAAGERFDLVIADPPAFIPRRKDLATGTAAYVRLNRLALRLVADPGFLVTCSCSHHLSLEAFRQVVRRAASQAGRRVRLLETGHQGPDHPVHPALPESDYLKCLYLHVTG